MSYTPTTWVDGKTPVNAQNMNKIEEGIRQLDTNKLDADALQGAVDSALSQAKASGAFKGDKGDTGTTPKLSIGTVTTLSAGSNATASITGTTTNPVLNLGIPKGADGSGGSGGTGGYTPVRGTDYWTPEDIAEIKSYVDDAILGGAW